MSSKIWDKVATFILYFIAVLITLILGGMLLFIFTKGIGGVSLDFLTKESKSFEAGGGIGPQLFNSFFLLVLTMIITLPIGIGGGIYMAEFSKPNTFTNIVRTIIEVLSSLPSIVVGLFGLLIWVQYFNLGFSLIAGALTLMIFNLPLMVRVTEQAIRAVDVQQKEASLAMGITHWHTIIHVILPAALPEIMTGTILAAGRVFGEAAALMYTAGMSSPTIDFSNWNPLSPSSPISLFRQAETLAVHIWKVNSEGLAPDAGQIVSSASLVLVVSVLIFNILARFLGKKLHKKFTGN